jgi:hypothetical protein
MLLRSIPFLAVLAALILGSFVVVVRVRPRSASWPVRFLWIAAVSTLSFIPSVILHNLVSGLLKIEEPVFFLLAIIGAPLGLLVGLVGAVVSAALHRKRSA